MLSFKSNTITDIFLCIALLAICNEKQAFTICKKLFQTWLLISNSDIPMKFEFANTVQHIYNNKL